MPEKSEPEHAWLSWYAAIGADEPILDAPQCRYQSRADANPPARAPQAQPDAVAGSPGPAEGLASAAPAPVPPKSGELLPVGRAVDARALAATCHSLDALIAALEAFDGCPLKQAALNLCVYDGNPQAPVMLIGEAPGAEEDRQGKPFVGQSGQLLDRILACIDLDRSGCFVTNTIFWRPPGNRTPTFEELATCLPFLERQIALLQPKVLMFVGGTAARALLGLNEGITRMRGRRYTYRVNETLSVPAFVTFHPAYLLRQPGQKRLAWRDWVSLRQWLDANV